MAVNRGKQFEQCLKEAFQKVPNTTVVRLHDQTTGFAGGKNPCDFIIYHRPIMYAIECKSVHGNILPFSNITDYQWSELLKFSEVEGMLAGVICWWIDKDVTMFLPIQIINDLRYNQGYKSYRFDWFHWNGLQETIKIKGQKKRVFFEYDMEDFFNNCYSNFIFN